MTRSLMLGCALFAGVANAQPPTLLELEPAERAVRFETDAAAVRVYRDGVAAAVAYARAQPALFAKPNGKRPAILSGDAREQLRGWWQRMLDYYLALDSVRRYHAAFPDLIERAERERGLLVHYAAFLAQYRFALDVLTLTDGHAEIDIVLDEPVPELGLPQGSFADFKLRFLNVLRATEFAALAAVYQTSAGRAFAPLRAAIAEDAKRVRAAGRGIGPVLTAKNGLTLVRRAGAGAFFPVQAGVAEWMGDTKIYRVKRSLVSQEQIRALALEPGDILLERREWYLSNVGLPGYWPHAALYVGTPVERARYFADPQVQEWVRARGEPSGELDRLLRRDFAAAYDVSVVEPEHGRAARVLEAVSEGVSFTTLEHSAEADALAVLRPRLTKRDKAAALWRAFRYHGRPYDFEFDFRSDAALVCTELIYKSYEPSSETAGLQLPLLSLLGRVATPANELVRQFDAQYGTPAQQTDLVVFLDGSESTRRAHVADLDTFRASWRRPKWHIVTAKSPRTDVAAEDIPSPP